MPYLSSITPGKGIVLSKEESGFLNILKWAGIAALLVVPVVVIVKKLRNGNDRSEPQDDGDIFSAELED